jgi:hypothetical protein
MFEKRIHGGVATFVCWSATAQNHYINVISTNEINFIMYYDANNLYWCALSSPLPTGDFRYLDKDDIENLKVQEIKDDDSVGDLIE